MSTLLILGTCPVHQPPHSQQQAVLSCLVAETTRKDKILTYTHTLKEIRQKESEMIPVRVKQGVAAHTLM